MDTTLSESTLPLYSADRSFCSMFDHYTSAPGHVIPDSPLNFQAPTVQVRYLECPDKLWTVYSEYAETSILATLSDTWDEALLSGEEAAEIALLISLTRNLEHIEFCVPDFSLEEDEAPEYFWPSLLAVSQECDPARHFHRLKSVVVHRRYLKRGRKAHHAHYGFEIGPFLPFIGLPKLKIFHVENDRLGEYDAYSEDYSLNGEESHLTDLLLGVSHINPEKILQILKRCTKLEAFDCDFAQPDLDYVPNFDPNFSWYTIKEALMSSRHTLKELTLDSQFTTQLASEESVSIGSLADFTSLKKLHVSQLTLLGFECVSAENLTDDHTLVVPALPFEEMSPSSLESLYIDRCSLTIVPYLEAMSTNLEDRFPNLRVIRLGEVDLDVWGVEEYPEDEQVAVVQGREDRVERLKERFIAAGVQWSWAFNQGDES